MKKHLISLLFSCSITLQTAPLERNIDTAVAQINNETQNALNSSDQALYLYVIHRLENAVNVIQQIHEKSIFHTLCNSEKGLCTIFEETVNFERKEIEACLKEIESSRNLHCFFTLWEKIKTNYQMLDITTLKEFSILILAIYKLIYDATYKTIKKEEEKSLALGALVLLFGNISSLHAFELLSIISKLTQQIPKLLEKYELTNHNLSWSEWLKKYWWLPPLAITAITFEVIFLYQIAIGKTKLPKLKSAQRLFSKENKKT